MFPNQQDMLSREFGSDLENISKDWRENQHKRSHGKFVAFAQKHPEDTAATAVVGGVATVAGGRFLHINAQEVRMARNASYAVRRATALNKEPPGPGSMLDNIGPGPNTPLKGGKGLDGVSAKRTNKGAKDWGVREGTKLNKEKGRTTGFGTSKTLDQRAFTRAVHAAGPVGVDLHRGTFLPMEKYLRIKVGGVANKTDELESWAHEESFVPDYMSWKMKDHADSIQAGLTPDGYLKDVGNGFPVIFHARKGSLPALNLNKSSALFRGEYVSAKPYKVTSIEFRPKDGLPRKYKSVVELQRAEMGASGVTHLEVVAST